MEFSLNDAYLHRARSALDMLGGDLPRRERAAASFRELAYRTLLAGKPERLAGSLAQSADPQVQKAAAHATTDSVWSEGEAATLAASYIASIADGSLLDAIAKYARILPRVAVNALVASGMTANTIAEGAPKVTKHLDVALDPRQTVKAAALVVLSAELARATGGAGQRMFEAELAAAVTAASNQAVLDTLGDSSSIVNIAAGADPLANLRAGLRAAQSSLGYAVLMPAADVAWLATVQPTAGLGVHGGSFAPGIEIVPSETATYTTVVPASRVALLDLGLEVRVSGEASVDMRDSPSGAAQHVSLFQTNSLALLAEREFVLAGNPQIVRVGA